MVSNIRAQISNAADGQICYINTPVAYFSSLFFKISSFMFILYFFSFHPVMVAALVPAYAMVFYLYSLFWGVVKRYAFRLIPFMTVIAVANLPLLAIAILLRKLLYLLIF